MQQPMQNMVLAGIDGSSISGAVADYAAWIAKTVGSPLAFLHNIEQSPSPAVADLSGSIGLGSREHLLDELTELEAKRGKLLVTQGKMMLSQAVERAAQNGVTGAESCQRHGPLTETLVEWEDHIRVLVLGVRGELHDGQSGKLGNQLETIIRSLHKPVLVVNRNFQVPKRIMLAYDGSEAAGKALDMLCTSPLYKGMQCHLVYACRQGRQPGNLLIEAKARLQNAGLEVISAKLDGSPEQQLLVYQQAEDIQLMVMGSFGHSRLREMILGSLTLKMLTQSNVPLLMLR
ncbi:universal stress protein [Aliiglaciecola sp. CAU 1673]|uniref:universal stress protein n=1 Tax=Aliiglaciecola sp. CAU 1673 TaxID=3032595 RepID=UPI0023DC80D2|nr:universal stress protein [Aliiglaciecola sp. CAU 1673]MDF2178369.1 universal stress protein [Aliiglaciecola sp. CAU 1673]